MSYLYRATFALRTLAALQGSVQAGDGVGHGPSVGTDSEVIVERDPGVDLPESQS